MAILLAAITILQGTLLYFAGSNDTLLTLYILGGYTLFILAGVFAAFGPLAALITLAVLLLLGIILARRGIHPTREGYVDIVISYGKYAHTLYPGLNLLLPWEQVSHRLNTQETTWTTPQMKVPTSRDQDVQLTATISYQLMPEDAHLAALAVKDWEGSLRSLFVGTVQSVVNELTPGDFVAWTQSIYARSGDANSFNPAAATRWDRINSTLSRRMQDQIAAWGIQINWVRIQDVTPLPKTSGVQHVQHMTREDTGGTTQVMPNEPLAVMAPQRLEKTEALKSAPPPAPKPTPASKLPRVEVLVDMYNAVRQGVITDPDVITDIAQRFETLASDPIASKTIDFDAERAARTLRQRAQKIRDAAQNSEN